VSPRRPPKVDHHILFSPEVNAALDVLMAEDAAAEGLGAEPNRSATVARLVLAERARRAAGVVAARKERAR